MPVARANRPVPRAGWRLFGVVALFTISAVLVGCGSNGLLRRGRMAEERGNYERAYRVYCQAARARPSSRAVRSALTRVSQMAAQTWLNRGERFEQRKRHELAWRCYMGALLVRPDDKRALAGVQRLEQNHPQRLASVREAWRRHGERTLQVDDVDVRLASAGDQTANRHEGTKGSAFGGQAPPRDRVPSASEREHRSPERKRAGSRDGGREGLRVTKSQGPETPDRQPLMVAQASRPKDEGKKAGSTETLAVEVATEPAPSPAAASDVAPPPDRTSSAERPPATPEGYITTVVVSQEDERFRKTAALVDDLRVRVRDTDSDPDADVEILLGRRRLDKVKNWRVGEVLGVTGRSGRAYELVLLAIFDETETVRIGIRYLRGTRSD